MDCRQEENAVDCTCGSKTCPRRGICCECIANHREKGQLPGCLMPEALRGSLRSIADLVAYYAQQS
jgi:hypothetical protein